MLSIKELEDRYQDVLKVRSSLEQEVKDTLSRVGDWVRERSFVLEPFLGESTIPHQGLGGSTFKSEVQWRIKLEIELLSSGLSSSERLLTDDPGIKFHESGHSFSSRCPKTLANFIAKYQIQIENTEQYDAIRFLYGARECRTS